MKFGVNVLIVLALFVNSIGIKAIHFRSVGKNYNINYNSNTNTNLDLTKLYHTIVEQLYGSEIKAPLSTRLCSAGGHCSQLYEHLTASFSSDHQDEFEEDDEYLYDDIDEDALSIPEDASGSIPSTPEGDHHIVNKLMPISDENKLEIVELDAVAEAFSAVPLVNQSGQIISFDSVTAVARSSEEESDPLKPFNQTLGDDD